MKDRKVFSHTRYFWTIAHVFLLSAVLFFNTLLSERVFAEEASMSTEATTSISYNPYVSADVEARVREYFADIPVMIGIAQCESRFRQYDNIGNILNGGLGGMVGVFQINKKVHEQTALSLGFDVNTLEGNLGYARHLYEESGSDPWIVCTEKATRDIVLTGSANNIPSITATLKLGTVHNDVLTLQKTLNQLGFTVAGSGAGSPGNETNMFGSLTRAAVRDFQCAQGIVCDGNEKTTGYGLVGAKTRSALLKLLASNKGETVALGESSSSLE